jgi:hypothetical protein
LPQFDGDPIGTAPSGPFLARLLNGHARQYKRGVAMRPQSAFGGILSFVVIEGSKLFQIVLVKLPTVKGHSISAARHHDPRT